MLRNCTICAARVLPAMDRISVGEEALYARPHSWALARVRSCERVSGVRRSEELMVALWISATLMRSKTVRGKIDLIGKHE